MGRRMRDAPCLEIHICWKVDRDARMDPPIQTEYFLSGGATILTCYHTAFSTALNRGGRDGTDLHGGRSKSSNLLLHTVRDTGVPATMRQLNTQGMEWTA
jgi:hypothetical protein